jgi:DNA (cytosine-5)-methyltransferase 1
MNFPGVRHEVCDISQSDFRDFPWTDLLIASPECTCHSVARGVARADQQADMFGETLPKEAAQRSRATMWDVPRWLERMMIRKSPVRGGIVENVVDARMWIMFDAWAAAIRALGYEMRIVYLNSMHARGIRTPSAPQSRDRMYVAFWRPDARRTTPDFDKWTRPTGHCPNHGRVRALQAWKKPEFEWGHYREQYVYRCPACRMTLEPEVLPAATALDWGQPAGLIGERKRPLAQNTLRRVRAGLDRYGTHIRDIQARTAPDAPEPAPAPSVRTDALLVPAGGTWNDTAHPVTAPMRTRTAVETDALLIPYYRTGVARPTSHPIGTLSTRDRYALVDGPGVAAGDIEDCRFRMLTVGEIQAAMAFTPSYHLAGTSRRVKIRQLGNAVTPCAMELLMSALAEYVTGDALALAA